MIVEREGYHIILWIMFICSISGSARTLWRFQGKPEKRKASFQETPETSYDPVLASCDEALQLCFCGPSFIRGVLETPKGDLCI